ncbi:hypothetical protein E1293_21070 [Actinomadura darangshiensis]|uniref:Repetin n=1 Tax=Actinomadura darangshiensis TaxID=705336 RepID=A0A4R5B7A7_9ACTN|nr:hypothetical protein [Actinomadura darangshiensis]TDD80326.1 hypothetical protein E1293_21070 [Actinomadura darangshiensis]
MPSIRTKSVLVASAAIVAVGGATTAYAADPGDGPAAESARPGVRGAADFRMPFTPDKDVRHFEFDARAAPYTRPFPGMPHGLPSDAAGTVKVSHYLAQRNTTVHFEAAVDCMITSPGYAALTAKVVRADDLVQDWVGRRLGFSVQDAGRDTPGHIRDRVGFSWLFGNVEEDQDGNAVEGKVGTCQAPAPFALVTKGGYTVEHADLTPAPQR